MKEQEEAVDAVDIDLRNPAASGSILWSFEVVQQAGPKDE